MKFTLQVDMPDRWVPHFLGMLGKMEQLGIVGSSRKVTIYADGDGDFRPKFSWDKDLPKSAKPISEDDDIVYDAG